MPWARALVSVLAVLAAWPPGARAALPAAATEDPWVEVSTARFRVYSNADEAAASEAARHLERLADAMQHTSLGLRVDGGREVHVYLFRDRASFRPYCPFSDDDLSTTAGFHVSGQDVEFIAFYTPLRDAPARFASHEYTHAVLARSLGELPTWIDEGLAEFYSTFEAHRRSADIGRPIPEHVASLRRGMLPIEDLLVLGHNSPIYERGSNRETVYAQSWALVHALVMDPADGGRRFGALLSELVRGRPSAEALRLVYGPNASDSLQRRLREYVSLGTLPYSQWDFAQGFDEAPVRARALGHAEILTVLGELIAHTRESLYPSAREHLEAAWSEDSTHALPAALLAELAERQGDRAEAAQWIAAVQRSSDREPRPFAIAGIVLARRRTESSEPLGWPAPGASADAQQARSLLSRAVASRPNDSDWLAQLGMTYLDDSVGVYDGVAALFQAQQDWPRRGDIVGALAILNLRAGNRGTAVGLYSRIPLGPERLEWRARVGYLLERQTRAEVNNLMGEERADEAESLVVRLRRDVTEAGVASRCDDLLAWIRESRPAARPAASGATSSSPHGKSTPARGSAPAPDPLSRADRAMAMGEYDRAERLIGELRSQAKAGPWRVHLDSLAADARNRRRLQAANDLIRKGWDDAACRLFDLILADEPRVDLRREIERQRTRRCH